MKQQEEPIEMSIACPVCEAKDSYGFFTLGGVPVNVCVQWSSREEARHCPKGDMRLVFCRNCGFIWNAAFEGGLLDYSQAYENSLFYSGLYRDYTEKLVGRLIERYDLRNKDIIDIGCGKGDFLFLVCRMGSNRGVGFDTSYEDGVVRQGEEGGQVRIIRDFYSEKYGGYQSDLICSRYVFEHIAEPRAFLSMIRRAIGRGRRVIVYFEVPNVQLILRDLSVWDIIYEHCGYFSQASLERVFRICGFEVLSLYDSYEGQFLGIEASAADGAAGPGEMGQGYQENLQEITREVEEFVEQYRGYLRYWRETLNELAASGKRAVLWGAGAKGVSFLNMLGVNEAIGYVVDINPRKRGKYIAGTGQEIVGPEFLQEYRPDTVILTNPIYREEIEETVNRLGVHPEFVLYKSRDFREIFK